jgi:hypothetical protein
MGRLVLALLVMLALGLRADPPSVAGQTVEVRLRSGGSAVGEMICLTRDCAVLRVRGGLVQVDTPPGMRAHPNTYMRCALLPQGQRGFVGPPVRVSCICSASLTRGPRSSVRWAEGAEKVTP